MRALLALLLVSTVFAGCLGGNTTPTPAANNSTSSTTGAMNMTMTATVELGESPTAPAGPAIGPGSMYLKATGMDALVVGMPVNVTVTNKGGMDHDLVIEGTDFKTGVIAAGKSVTKVWTPTKDGTFGMYCDLGFSDPAGAGVATHRGAGMEGKATVKKAM